MIRAAAPVVSLLQRFLAVESAAGFILIGAAALALIVSNSGLSDLYQAFLDLPVTIRVGALKLDKPLLLWINDGLMAVFFLLVGLEIKRELREGELSSLQRALLPAVAAVGGMAAPAAIYVLFNLGDATALRGWAVPAATDIAFAVAVLSLAGPAVPTALKAFLVALAIIDDLGAIVIIAVFYTYDLSLLSLGLAAVILVVMVALNLAGVTRITPYMLLGAALWVCVLKSGVHATLAGVATALTVPLRDREGGSPLHRLEHALHPWVGYLIMPVFGFANAGVSFAGITLAALTEKISLGIAFGLFAGKQIGVFGASWLAVRLRVAALPEGVGWSGLYAASIVTGIGFTMSLFIGTLAWEDDAHAAKLRLGVLAGSILSALVGLAALRLVLRRGR
ncbi:MAG: Na+/H+ antiporter NhaA [Dongiaceae bacterium]